MEINLVVVMVNNAYKKIFFLFTNKIYLKKFNKYELIIIFFIKY